MITKLNMLKESVQNVDEPCKKSEIFILNWIYFHKFPSMIPQFSILCVTGALSTSMLKGRSAAGEERGSQI